jgi:hypothetical protein
MNELQAREQLESYRQDDGQTIFYSSINPLAFIQTDTIIERVEEMR